MRRASRIAQTALVVAFLATAVSGCEQGGPASTAPASTAATKAAGSLRARADELSQRGQYEEALAAYREALRQEPNDLALRYAVAVTLASLNRRAEATEAYRWVFFNGLPGSELVEKSETWLRAAGALATTTESVPDKAIEKTATTRESAATSRGPTSIPDGRRRASTCGSRAPTRATRGRSTTPWPA